MISCLPSIATAVAAMRDGSLRSLDLVEFCLERIERFEPKLRAWVVVDAAGARREASRLDALATEGKWLGPLHGIPLGIKDIIDVAGFPTKAGSPLRDAHLATEDAVVIQQLRAAGAILLGKTVTTEFACFHPAMTANPWNPAHTPGGSSSGSAAAVASQMCMAALGSQTGGSILRPASYCGIAGFKPTMGIVSLAGVVPVSENLDHVGPLARSVSDLAQLFDALDDPVADQGQSTEAELPPPLRSIDQYFFERAAEPCVRVVRQALRALVPGTHPAFVLPGTFKNLHAMHRCIMSVDAARYHAEDFRQSRALYSQILSEMLDAGLATSDADYAAARQHQTEFQRAIRACFEQEQVFAVTPTTPAAAPGIETTGDPVFNTPWTYAGLPAITIPCGLDPDGLPLGLQLIAGPNRDRELLRAAAWCQSQLNLDLQPPLGE